MQAFTAPVLRPNLNHWALSLAVWWQPNVKRSGPSRWIHSDSQDVPAKQHPDWERNKIQVLLPLPPRGRHGGNLDSLQEHIFWTTVIHINVGSCQFFLRDTSEVGPCCHKMKPQKKKINNHFKFRAEMCTICSALLIFFYFWGWYIICELSVHCSSWHNNLHHLWFHPVNQLLC